MPLYTPKGKRIAQSNQYPPGWHPDVAVPQSQRSQPAAKKSEPAGFRVTSITEQQSARVAPAKINEITEAMQNSLKIRDDVVELSKRLKRLRRRLRELDLLDEKIKVGEIAKPQKDQLEKITRRREIEKEIEELERQREELKAQGFKQLDDDSCDERV